LVIFSPFTARMTSPAFEDRANCLSKTPILGLRAQDFSTPATSCLLLRDTMAAGVSIMSGVPNAMTISFERAPPLPPRY
jgi:hypothetical protein